MASLIKDLRRQLGNTVAEARKVAEEGAEQSLKRLAVDAPRPHDSLTAEERKFRVSLRVHARQLGDRLDGRPARLIQAVGYEHWHRLLFARFLIENELLLHPEHGIALSLDEVKEIALANNRRWAEVAAEYAQGMLLRRVFQPEDPALRVSLPPEKRLELEVKLNSLPREVFLADDSLGWVYQFWQKEAKEKANKSEAKIGADELAPVTQLFTEDYMVLFLLENTLGAWWTGRHGKPDLDGYTWSYLRLNEDGTPVAGTFDGWPKVARELRVLDPCMGSGHFLTFALPIVARMRVVEEGLSLSDAIVAVLRDNFFGLELDPRCSQIAAFNLALTAWKLAGKHFEIPQLNLACSGLGINTKEDDWVKLAGDDGRKQELMRWLYSLFRNAPTLGSLIDPARLGQPLFEHEIVSLLPLLQRALAAEQSSEDTKELAIAAQGLVAAARILSGKFTLVVTNVPYLVKAKQGEILRDYCETYAPEAAGDLATVFLVRCHRFCMSGGSQATVSPQNWLFLKSYKGFRKRLLAEEEVSHVTTIGSGQTATASWDVLRALVVGSNRILTDYEISGLGTDAAKEEERANEIRINPIKIVLASAIRRDPNMRLALGAQTSGSLLNQFASSLQGISTGDNPRFQGFFWEFLDLVHTWHFQQGVVPHSTGYGGREKVIRWEDGKGELSHSESAAIRGLNAIGKLGVAVTQMRSLPVTLFSGSFFDTNVAVILPHNSASLAAIWAYCSSSSFAEDVRKIDKKLNVTNATFGDVPFDLSRWEAIANRQNPSGLPIPHSSDPTQWLFDGHPKGSDHPLQVAVARLVGYHWPRQAGSRFPGCSEVNSDGLEACADEDGIVCIPAVAGEEPAVERLKALLRRACGEGYDLAGLLKDKKSSSLDDWLRDEFFDEHCRIFCQRPFVWHIWDGRKDGFHALVNYHKLDHKTLEKLIYSSLGDWIGRQRQDVASGVEGAEARLGAADHLQSELKKIFEGEKPYDVFVRWKPLKGQSIGWDPDLNDGVRINIRPWITEARLYRATKPGILRVTPNIKYGKDRGKEPDRDRNEFPWFEGTRDRNNDIHLSLDEKRRAGGLA